MNELMNKLKFTLFKMNRIELVESGFGLRLKLDRFLRTKEIHPQQGGKPFCFVTDGSLHLRMLLHPEAFHKNITLAPYFFKYHDLRKQFKQFYKPDRSIANIEDMMSCILCFHICVTVIHPSCQSRNYSSLLSIIYHPSSTIYHLLVNHL